MSPPMGAARAGIAGAKVSELPDSGMFQNPIYQWWGEEITASDGTSTVDWPESLAGLGDATAVGGPTKQTQSGFEAVLYDGTDDGHDYTPDSQLPAGDSDISFAALVYVNSTHDGDIGFVGGSNFVDDGEVDLRVESDGNVRIVIGGGDSGSAEGGSYSTGTWITVGGSIGATTNSNSMAAYLDGSSVATATTNVFNLQTDETSIGYNGRGGSLYFDGYVAEYIVCAADESGQAFSDYHNDRLGP